MHDSNQSILSALCIMGWSVPLTFLNNDSLITCLNVSHKAAFNE